MRAASTSPSAGSHVRWMEYGERQRHRGHGVTQNETRGSRRRAVRVSPAQQGTRRFAARVWPAITRTRGARTRAEAGSATRATALTAGIVTSAPGRRRGEAPAGAGPSGLEPPAPRGSLRQRLAASGRPARDVRIATPSSSAGPRSRSAADSASDADRPDMTPSRAASRRCARNSSRTACCSATTRRPSRSRLPFR